MDDALVGTHDDYFLVRWLRGELLLNIIGQKTGCINYISFCSKTARKWNLEAAEKMLRAVSKSTITMNGYNRLDFIITLQSLKTRAMWNVDNIEKWDPPKALQEYLPYGLMGYDNEGSPGWLRLLCTNKATKLSNSNSPFSAGLPLCQLRHVGHDALRHAV